MAKQVSPGVLALRKVVDDVHKDAREAKARGELVGWSSSKFPCELAAAFDLNVMYPENQAAGIAANRYGEMMCQAAEDLGYDNDICGYARISLAYAAGVRVSRKYDAETGEYIIDPATGKPLKDAEGNVVIDEATGKPKKDPKTQTPYLVLDNLLEIEALPDGPEKERRLEAISPIRQMRIPQPDFVLCCNNICNCMTKWYENIARMCNVPLIMIDIPYNNTVDVHDDVSRKYDAETGEYIIDPATGKPLKDAEGNVVIDEATGKPKKDPKTQTPYLVLDNLLEIEALPDGPEKERRLEAISPIRQMRIPQPDFVLCCNNICNCMTKWYENIARMCNVPLIMIDIPYNNTVDVHDDNVKYVRAQFDKAIKQLEELTGKKFDEKKFEKACSNANRTAQAWLKVCDYLQYKPAPYSGFDLFNHMADVVTARARVEAAEAFELLADDLEETVKKGETTTPFPEKYRVMFEGIPCWPKLPNLFKPLKEHGVNVTAVVYAPAFGFVYNNIDEMARAYYKAPNSVCIEQGVDWREGICRDNKVDGVLVHYNRSCKPWSGYMAEMQRRFTEDLGVPCAGFDGDQADPRNFNAAQYETRVQGLVEAMEANKQAKEAK